MRNPWPAKTPIAIVSFAAIMAGIAYLPAFEQFHVLRFESLSSIIDFQASPSQLDRPITGAYGHLVDRSHTLDTFYKSLARAEAGEPGAIVRVLHFGDSPISADQISADLRTLLQNRFGNAGQGFVLIAKPWAWYNHRGIGMSAKGWSIEAASQNYASDGLHGLGGATFEGGQGAIASFDLETAPQRVELQYWAQPGGGSLEITANGRTLAEVSTDSRTRGSAYSMVAIPASVRGMRLQVTSGRVRMFGVSFETDGPGVRYDSLGLNAAQILTPLRHFDRRHWAEQIRHQKPDLVVLNYGTNESGYPGYVDGPYAGDVRELVRRVREAVPDSPILLMSPMDRAARNAKGEIATLPKLPKLVDIQRQVAAEMGCAFFNTFQAMGGQGTMARWYDARPRLASADFMHPLPAGAKRLGTLINEALYEGYLAYKHQAQR